MSLSIKISPPRKLFEKNNILTLLLEFLKSKLISAAEAENWSQHINKKIVIKIKKLNLGNIFEDINKTILLILNLIVTYKNTY